MKWYGILIDWKCLQIKTADKVCKERLNEVYRLRREKEEKDEEVRQLKKEKDEEISRAKEEARQMKEEMDEERERLNQRINALELAHNLTTELM